jgi:DNA-binding GntR family transcriptional regulator
MPTNLLAHKLAGEIRNVINAGRFEPGAHLSVQKFADEFHVSRSPVRQAMGFLAQTGLLEHKHNRGFFVRSAGELCVATNNRAEVSTPFEEPNEYQILAKDWLSNQLPAEVSEQFLRDHYQLTKAQLTETMVRAVREGWAERKLGYGWRFLPVAKSWTTFQQIYRFRALIEPAAMFEPTYRIDRAVLAKHRCVQENMMEYGIERLPGEQILDSSSHLHEDLIQFSGNPFFHQALTRVNRMRRLLEYRSGVDRQRMYRFCAEHLEVIALLERGEVIHASETLRHHLEGALQTKLPKEARATNDGVEDNRG